MSVRILTVAALLCAALASAAVARPYPETIPLPDRFQPEGIDIRGNDFFVGSIPTGAVYRGNLRTGEGDVLVPGREGRAAIGLKVRGDRIFVAGGPTGKAFVYDASDGSDVGEFVLTTAARSFINDVALARGAAYFTDSVNPQLYVLRQGEVETLPLTGELMYDGNPDTFELNGIAPAGRRLIAVQSRTGELFYIDPRTGVTEEIDLGGETLPNGDGLLRQGKTLYVVQNRLNQVAVVDLRRGEIVRHITDDDFAVPTTVARKGRHLWLPNARFGMPPSTDDERDVVRVTSPKASASAIAWQAKP